MSKSSLFHSDPEMVGGTVVFKGIQKFLYPDELGVGRFIKIGIPAPEVTAPFR
jgi:putative oxidoreductase